MNTPQPPSHIGSQVFIFMMPTKTKKPCPLNAVSIQVVQINHN